MYTRTQLLHGWGRTCPSTAEVSLLAPGEAPRTVLSHVGSRGIIPRGLGRSYGDAAQNGGGLVVELPSGMSLDQTTGVLTVAAGTSLDDIMRVVVPQGWFVPVTPGTRYVTVGGAIAADIHGKNHHRDGTFGMHVLSLDLLTAGGDVRTIGPSSPDDADRHLFWATVGGMGLTGVIVQAQVQLIPVETSRISVDTTRTGSLEELMDEMVQADAYARYSVAWLDSVATGSAFGRGVLTTGEHAVVDELPTRQQSDPLAYDPSVLASAPPFVPSGLLNKLTVRAFNEAWFRKAPKSRRGEIQSIAAFFHPLDGVRDWNRIYGPGGFLQYQFAVPDDAGDLVGVALRELQRVGAPAFLSVLKRFGPENSAMLSFPKAGWTLALDVPARVPGLGAALDWLDAQVIESGGRFYLAKDSRASGATIVAGYPRWQEFCEIKAAVDPHGVFQSDLSRRLGL